MIKIYSNVQSPSDKDDECDSYGHRSVTMMECIVFAIPFYRNGGTRSLKGQCTTIAVGSTQWTVVYSRFRSNRTNPTGRTLYPRGTAESETGTHRTDCEECGDTFLAAWIIFPLTTATFLRRAERLPVVQTAGIILTCAKTNVAVLRPVRRHEKYNHGYFSLMHTSKWGSRT